jgi:putative flippase GtrA
MGVGATARAVRELAARTNRGVRSGQNWVQLAKFCVVGASGYVINLAVFAALVAAGLHYASAAVLSFGVAVTNNYIWNRIWTFRGARGHIGYQGIRFFIVALVALAVNEILLLLFVSAGSSTLAAQALAVALATPVNFVGNKIWSFSSRRAQGRRAATEGTLSEV